MRWALQHLPFYGRWYRFLIFWPGCDKGLDAARVDPDYRRPQRGDQRDERRHAPMFTDWITSQVGDDPDLLAKVVPDYPATGKRTLQDNGSWLRTLTRDNVELVRTGIDHIERRRGRDRGRHALRGRRDRVRHRLPRDQGAVPDEDHRVATASTCATMWGERPAAYLGITVPGFPNFFCMYGPGTNLAHGGSLIFHSECQMRYIAECLDQLIDGGHRTMEPRQEKYDDWHARSQAEMKTLVWSQPSIEALVLQERLRRDPRSEPVAHSSTTGAGPSTPTSTTSSCADARSFESHQALTRSNVWMMVQSCRYGASSDAARRAT